MRINKIALLMLALPLLASAEAWLKCKAVGVPDGQHLEILCPDQASEVIVLAGYTSTEKSKDWLKANVAGKDVWISGNRNGFVAELRGSKVRSITGAATTKRVSVEIVKAGAAKP